MMNDLDRLIRKLEEREETAEALNLYQAVITVQELSTIIQLLKSCKTK
jgi:hypothetical protein